MFTELETQPQIYYFNTVNRVKAIRNHFLNKKCGDHA